MSRAVASGATRERGYFADADYRGKAEAVFNETADLQDLGFNNQVSSIEIPPGQVWEVCGDPNYQNHCEVLDRSVPNLAAIGMNHGCRR